MRTPSLVVAKWIGGDTIVTAEMEPRLQPPVKSQLFGNRARRPAHDVETRWKRRVQRIVVPAASTISPRIGLISADLGGHTRGWNLRWQATVRPASPLDISEAFRPHGSLHQWLEPIRGPFKINVLERTDLIDVIRQGTRGMVWFAATRTRHRAWRYRAE